MESDAMPRIEIRDDAQTSCLSTASDSATSGDDLRDPEQTRARLSRLTADFDNYRRRTQREAAECREHGKAEVLADVVEIADTLGRALSSGAADPEALRQGLTAVHRRVLHLLDCHSVQAVQSLGRPFDPELHEAVGTVPPNGVPAGCVAAEERRGYLLNGRLLRPARVVVAREQGARENDGWSQEVSSNGNSNQGLL